MQINRERLAELAAARPNLSALDLKDDPLITCCSWDPEIVITNSSSNATTTTNNNTENAIHALVGASTDAYLHNCMQSIPKEYTQQGASVPLLNLQELETRKYCSFPLGCEEVPRFDRTRVRVLGAPAVDVLCSVQAAHVGSEVAYLNMGAAEHSSLLTRTDPAEAELVSRTTLLLSLTENVYPLGRFQAVFSKNVRVIRGGPAEGYPFSQAPLLSPRVSVATVPKPLSKPPPRPSTNARPSASAEVAGLPRHAKKDGDEEDEGNDDDGDEEDYEEWFVQMEEAFNMFYLELRAKIEMLFAVCAREGMDVLVVGPLPCCADRDVVVAYVTEAIKSVALEFAGFFSHVYVVPPPGAAQVFANVLVGTNGRAANGAGDFVPGVTALLLLQADPTVVKEYDCLAPWLIKDRYTQGRSICPCGGKCFGYDEFHGVEFHHPPHCPRGSRCNMSEQHKLLFTHDERVWELAVEAEACLMRRRAWGLDCGAPVPRSLAGAVALLPLPRITQDMSLEACRARIDAYQDSERACIKERVRVDRRTMDTVLPIHKIDLMYLRYWCRAAGFELLYRASVGSPDFSADGFHRCCDGVGPTLVLIYDGAGVFGGYTEAPWDLATPPELSGREFIFTLSSNNNNNNDNGGNSNGNNNSNSNSIVSATPMRFSLAPTYTAAVSHTPGFGPVFGTSEIRTVLRDDEHPSIAQDCGNYAVPRGCTIAPTGRRFFIHKCEVFRVIQDDDEFESLKEFQHIEESEAPLYAERSPSPPPPLLGTADAFGCAAIFDKDCTLTNNDDNDDNDDDFLYDDNEWDYKQSANSGSGICVKNDDDDKEKKCDAIVKSDQGKDSKDTNEAVKQIVGTRTPFNTFKKLLKSSLTWSFPSLSPNSSTSSSSTTTTTPPQPPAAAATTTITTNVTDKKEQLSQNVPQKPEIIP